MTPGGSLLAVGWGDLPGVVQFLVALLGLLALVAVAWPVARAKMRQSTAEVWREHAEALEARLKEREDAHAERVAELRARVEAAEREAHQATARVTAMEEANRLLLRDAMGVDAIEDLAKAVREYHGELVGRLDVVVALLRNGRAA